ERDLRQTHLPRSLSLYDPEDPELGSAAPEVGGRAEEEGRGAAIPRSARPAGPGTGPGRPQGGPAHRAARYADPVPGGCRPLFRQSRTQDPGGSGPGDPGRAGQEEDPRRALTVARFTPAGNPLMTANRVRSREAFERACRVIPGGVNSPARAFGAVGGQP